MFQACVLLNLVGSHCQLDWYMIKLSWSFCRGNYHRNHSGCIYSSMIAMTIEVMRIVLRKMLKGEHFYVPMNVRLMQKFLLIFQKGQNSFMCNLLGGFNHFTIVQKMLLRLILKFFCENLFICELWYYEMIYFYLNWLDRWWDIRITVGNWWDIETII